VVRGRGTVRLLQASGKITEKNREIGIEISFDDFLISQAIILVSA
jgi:hypothetical protein